MPALWRCRATFPLMRSRVAGGDGLDFGMQQPVITPPRRSLGVLRWQLFSSETKVEISRTILPQGSDSVEAMNFALD